ARLERTRRLASACRLQGLVLRTGAHGEAAWIDGGARTLGPAGARQAGSAGELHVDHRLATLIVARLPLDTVASLGTGRRARIPVDGKVRQGAALPRPALPVLVLRRRPHQV